MRRPWSIVVLVVLAVVLTVGSWSWATHADAQDATPAAGVTTTVYIEHNDAMTDSSVGDEGPSAGDVRVWEPNALYDEADVSDTGVRSQGSCISFNTDFDCLANETIIFPDGSTLEVQGLQLGNAQPSTRTIVGGSGQYRGATGTVSVAPTEDLLLWEKTIEIVPR